MRAHRLVDESKVSISFKRTRPNQYFIVSGIIKDDQTAESKLTVRFNETGIEVITQCNCTQWTMSQHCAHTAALLLRYSHIESEVKSLPQFNRRPFLNDEGVHINEYGTIISSTKKLLNAPLSTRGSYLSLNYKLVDGSLKHFPLPQPFEGKIAIQLYPSHKLLLRESTFESEDVPKDLYLPRFKLIQDGNIIEEISLFENLYLFNWVTGDSYHLPDHIKSIIEKLRPYPFGLTIQDYLRLTAKSRNSDLIEISLDDIELSQIETSDSQAQVSITESARKNYFDLTFQFINQSNIVSPLPFELNALVFNNGLLDTFKKKVDAYNFLDSLVQSFRFDMNHLNKFTRSSSMRDYFNFIGENLLSFDNLEVLNHISKTLDNIPTHHIKTLLTALCDIYTPQCFRFSHYSLENNSLTIEIRKSILLEHVYKLHQILSAVGINIYYNDNKVGQWNSNVKFSRRKNDIDWFSLDLELGAHDLKIIEQADLDSSQVLTSEGLVLLSPEQKGILKLLKRYTHYEASEKIPGKKTKRFTVPFHRSRIFELFELKKMGIDGALTDEEIAFCEKLLNLKGIPDYPLPTTLKGDLRPYQMTGYHWLRFLYENRFGACLADDMGLGKTIQSISFLESVYTDELKIMIVCPVSILMNWFEEFKKFSTLSDKISMYYGGEREYNPNANIIITSYGVMKRESSTTFKDQIFDILILDEVQNLKNVRSLGATSARRMNARFRVCLTGTPVENDLSEFYNIMDLSVPGIWGSQSFFKSSSIKKSRLIAKKMARPFILRRTKKEVLTDLPDKIENLVYLKFSDKERENYIYKLSQVRTKVESVVSKKRYGEVLKSLLELRQLCLWQKNPDLLSTKVKYLIKNLEQITAEGHQTLIFSQFTTYLDIIQSHIVEKGYKFSRIDGSYSLKKREENVKQFQSGENQIFLISLKAGGLGLNLTAASYIFIMDPWWNPAVESQAVDRAHRIGQEKAINVYRLIIKDSIEEKVLKLQRIKQELFDDLLSKKDDQYFTGKLSMKDFEALLTNPHTPEH